LLAINSVVFIPGFDLAITMRGNKDLDDHRTATYLAVFDVLLVLHRAVNEDCDNLTAVRAVNVFFLKQVHESLILLETQIINQGGFMR
jgi:hypothetical protein